jgi:ParB family chromosome partitioning protein
MSNQSFQIPIHNLSSQSKQSLKKILLSDLPPDEALLSDAPSRELIEDIGIRGQQDPILVTLDQSGKYIVIAGRRRIKALRVLLSANPEAVKTVNAIIFTDIDQTSVLNMAAIENNLRSENPLTDLQAITNLMDKNPGISFSEISRQTGIPISRVKKRLKLVNLAPEIKQAVVDNKITTNVAENIAKLGPVQQNELVNMYLQKGKLSQENVIVAQRAVVQNTANSLLPAFVDLDISSSEEIKGYVLLYSSEKLSILIHDFDKATDQLELEPGAILCKVVKL